MGFRSAVLCIALIAATKVAGQLNGQSGSNQHPEIRTFIPNQEFERRVEPVPRKVKIDVYYETDCPDSMSFVTNQLYPAYEELGDIMNVQLFPFGKAMEIEQRNGSYRFECHHGPAECFGNTLQSCAIHYHQEISKHLPFIRCMESYRRPSQNGQKCARRTGLDWDTLESCAESDLGKRLLHTNAKHTNDLRPNLHFVPWIVINNEYTYRNQRLALRNLKTAICQSYTGPTHPRCVGRLARA